MSKELIEGVFCDEDSPDLKYILQIDLLLTAKGRNLGYEESMYFPATNKLMHFSNVVLDEIVQITFTETGLAGKEGIYGFSYKVLEV